MTSFDRRADMERAAAHGTLGYKDPRAGAGLVGFAAVMLGLAGLWNVIEGLLAIGGSRVYVADSTFVFSNLNSWGWIVTILGVVQLVAAFTVLGGSELGRWFGIGAAALAALGQLFFMSAYPFWGVIMFAVDLVIIYALTVYGGKQLRIEP